jgi:membrane protein YdbS with pleckstrin-like domain
VASDLTYLRAIPLFASLKDNELAYIGGIVKQTKYPANEIILRQAEDSETFYILAAGQARVLRRDETGVEAIIRLLGPGQYFGETGLLYGEPRNATVQAATPATLLYIEKDDFNAMVARLSSVRKQLEESAGRRSSALGLSRFDWQMSDEIVLWVAQRNVVPLILESMGGLLFWHFIAGMLLLISFSGLPLVGHFTLAWQWGLRIVAVLIISSVWLWYLVDWTNDFFVLTNKRVIHVERYGILREMREEVPIGAVQNVVTSRAGLVDLWFGLGTITIETIGGKLIFTHITRVQALQERILDQRTYALQEARREEREAIRRELQKILKPESLAEPVEATPPPDAAVALSQLQPKLPPRPSLAERLRSLRLMRTEKGGEITWRKHWLVLFQREGGPLLFGLCAVALLVVLLAAPQLFRAQSVILQVTLILSLMLLVALIWGWWEFLLWRGDIYILTASRIVDIERWPLGLRETRRESGLDRIQDIDVNVPNLLWRTFGVGNVHIKTGAAGADLTFRSVANPYEIQRDIFHRLGDLRRRQEEQRRRQTMDDMTKWLTVYNELTTKLEAETKEESEEEEEEFEE